MSHRLFDTSTGNGFGHNQELIGRGGSSGRYPEAALACWYRQEVVLDHTGSVSVAASGGMPLTPEGYALMRQIDHI